MTRTLTSRGLVAVFVGLVVLGTGVPPAFAGGRHLGHRRVVLTTGTWVDPSPSMDRITVSPAGDSAQVDISSGSYILRVDLAR